MPKATIHGIEFEMSMEEFMDFQRRLSNPTSNSTIKPGPEETTNAEVEETAEAEHGKTIGFNPADPIYVGPQTVSVIREKSNRVHFRRGIEIIQRDGGKQVFARINLLYKTFPEIPQDFGRGFHCFANTPEAHTAFMANRIFLAMSEENRSNLLQVVRYGMDGIRYTANLDENGQCTGVEAVQQDALI